MCCCFVSLRRGSVPIQEYTLVYFLLLVQRIVAYRNQGGALLLALVGFLRLRLVEPSCSVRHAPCVFVLFTMRDPAWFDPASLMGH